MRVNFQAIGKFTEEVKQNPNLMVKAKSVTGQCNFQEGRPHFEASVEYAKGANKIASDQPPFMGGGGSAPDPINYCLYGLAACFAGTMMMVISQRGLSVDKLTVTAYNRVNLSKALGLGEKPLIEQIGLKMQYAGAATLVEMNDVVAETMRTCPGAYCVTTALTLETKIEKSEDER